MRLPHRALTNFDLIKYAKLMKIPRFRGVFMRNDLPKNGPLKSETAIVNLDDQDGPGTHWVAYKKDNNNIIYFDSFGNLKPPPDLIHYFGVGSQLNYNHTRYQDYNTIICGHLCLAFLSGKL